MSRPPASEPCRSLARLVLLVSLVQAGCAAYGLHRPARVLDDGQQEVFLSFDLVRFWARAPEQSRGPDVLAQLLLLPTLHYCRGLPGETELDLGLFPVGLRAGLRAQLAGGPGQRGAVAAEVGASLVGALGTGEDENWRVLLLPDAALTAGWAPDLKGEAFASLRYLWLRDKIAGASFTHTPGLTVGYARDLQPLALELEATALHSIGAGDWIFAPGFGAGLLSSPPAR